MANSVECCRIDFIFVSKYAYVSVAVTAVICNWRCFDNCVDNCERDINIRAHSIAKDPEGLDSDR